MNKNDKNRTSRKDGWLFNFCQFLNFRFLCRLNKGFTLIELLVVGAIITVVSTVILLNFRASSATPAARQRIAIALASDIRRAQSMASSTLLLEGEPVCGYGISYKDSETYLIFAGQAGASTCADTNRTYQSAIDAVTETVKLKNDNFEIANKFKDIFFEPPDPTTYIQNDSSLDQPPEEIIIREKGLDCDDGDVCTTIKVFASGKIDIE